MPRFLLFLVIGLVHSLPAVAQVYRLRILSPSCGGDTCRLVTSYASAVAIGRYQPGKELLLTAGHAVRGPVQRIELDVNGQWRLAVVVEVAAEPTDLAVIGLESPRPLPCALVAESTPQPGAEVWLVTHPLGGTQQRRSARLASSRYHDECLVASGASQSGESGGGVFDADRRLIGILYGTAPAGRPTHTLITGAARIRQFLRTTFQADPPPCGAEIPVASRPGTAESNCDCLRQEVATLTRRVGELEAALEAVSARQRLPPSPVETVSPAEFARLVERVRRVETSEIPVEILAPDGHVLDRHRYALGQPIQFRLVPKRE